MNNSITPLIKTVAKYLLIIATVFAVLGSIANSLTLYIGSTGLGANHGAAATFSVASFVVGTAISVAGHFCVLSLLAVIGAVAIGVAINVMSKNTPENNTKLAQFALIGLAVDSVVSLALAVMNSAAMYLMLSTMSDKSGLILVDSVLSGALFFCYLVPVLGFVGCVTLTIIGVITMLFFSKSAKSPSRK